MDKIIRKLRPIAAFVGLCCLWAYLLFSFIAAIGQMAEGEGVLLAYQIFNLFAVLCLLAAFVIFLLQHIFPALRNSAVLKIVTYALLGGHVFFSFVGWILYTVGMAQYAEYTWFWIIESIGTKLFIPSAFLFGYMYFSVEGEDKHPFKKKAKAEKKEEPKQEEAAPAEEQPAE